MMASHRDVQADVEVERVTRALGLGRSGRGMQESLVGVDGGFCDDGDEDDRGWVGKGIRR